MVSPSFDKPPKRPIISSLTAAMADLKRWLEESCLTTFHDADGQAWQLGIKVTRPADPDTANGLLWCIRLTLSAQVSGAELVATGVLSPAEDHRLLYLIGEDLVPLAMRPTVYRASDEAEAKRLLAKTLPELKDALLKQSLVAVKRDLVGRWIDGRCGFGSRDSSF